RGLNITLSRFSEPHSGATHERYAWYDRVRIPDLLGVEGVAGAWTFSLQEHQRHSSLPLGGDAEDAPRSLRMRLLYLDHDPLAVTQRIIDFEHDKDTQPGEQPR